MILRQDYRKYCLELNIDFCINLTKKLGFLLLYDTKLYEEVSFIN